MNLVNNHPSQISPLLCEIKLNLLLIVRSTLPHTKDALVMFSPKIHVDVVAPLASVWCA